MQSTLIILRGNSGSGKTTTAKKLQEYLGFDTLVVSQDAVRREMLHTNDTSGNLSIELIKKSLNMVTVSALLSLLKEY